TTGDDANPGTKDRPLKTLAAAQAAVRAHPDRGTVAITVTVLSGTYYLGQTLLLTAADSGTKAAPVTYRGGGTATLSGGARLNLTWTAYKNGILQAIVPASVSGPLSFDVLFLNGQRQRMARYPNYKAGVVPFGGGSADAVSATRVASWSHSPVGGFVHGLHAQKWGSEHYVIKGVNSSHQLQLDGPFCNGRPDVLLDGSQVVENIFDELDAPGEWYFDRAAGILYLYPPSGTDLASATIEVAGVERIVEFQGTSAAPVQWITLDGFHYTHTSRTFPKATEIILRSDWEIYRGGAVFVTGAEDSNIQNSFFDQVGGAGVFVNGYDRRVNVTGNKFVGTGSSAILFIGSPSAVRNPLFGYGAAPIAVADLDKTPGPKTVDYPAECSATDNLIHDIGDPEKQVAGVGIDIAQDITVSHNSIYSVPRAGINIGDGCWGGHVVSYNDVFDTVLETGDHGAFNSWSRDRYWQNGTSAIEARVAAYPGLPQLDTVKPITLNDNRWRCDHGWDVDLDDGSTNYVISNNVFLSGGLKWREGYNRTGDNNVFADGRTMSVHVWPTNSGDVFTHNIFSGYSPVSPDGWGKELDYNLFTSGSALTAAHGYGVDAHSASGAAGFVDAAHGNYQLAASSAALALGIKSLPADTYGVTSLGLRAQARTPYFDSGGSMPDAGTRDPTPETWRGAQVKNLIGLDEQSATGIGGDIGVIVVSVPAQSPAATDGFQPLDVILEFGGQSVVSLDDLNRLYAAATAGQKVAVGVHRSQQDTVVTITR
ncbi:MAG TPA: PDZ domain-containing protein, partial [Polyangiaceae bacterium]|nr:PDZ domain-containing protein [Polyangiaceae bacterium]